MKELQIAPPQDSEMFNLTFELTEPEPEIISNKQYDASTEVIKQPKSIFGQLCSFSSKFIEKLNG